MEQQKLFGGNYLIFDTETTGLPRSWKAPLSDLDNWPRMVQLAWELYDPKGAKLDEQNLIISPNGFDIPREVSLLHGISQERAEKEGIVLAHALEVFGSAVRNSDFLVAHNLSFDEKIVGAEYLREKKQNVLEGKNRICTMESSVEYCAIPGAYGNKWPKLQELHQKLFNEGFLDAHNAAVDVAMTAKCFWRLKEEGVI